MTDVNLFCWVDGFYPQTISVEWYKDNTLFPSKQAQPDILQSVKKERSFATRSQISINANEWNGGAEFTCKATHKGKAFSQTWSKCKADPSSKPRIRLEKSRLISTESKVIVSCIVETRHKATVSWLVDRNQKVGEATEHRLYETVSNLTIPAGDLKNWQTITCTAVHRCFNKVQETLNLTGSVQNTPTVVIRRVLADIQKGDSTVLECAARDLPSGMLSITLKANDAVVPEVKYVDLPESLDTLTTRFTVPKEHRTKDKRFTCEIQQSGSRLCKSSPTGNLFAEPSVELSAVSSVDNSKSATHILLCSGTGLNPKITWSHSPVENATSTETVEADGRMKVSIKIQVSQQKWNSGDTFTCKVSDQDNFSVQKNISACKVSPDFAQMPQGYLLGPSINDVRKKHKVSVTCLLFGHRLDIVSVSWKIGNVIASEAGTKKTHQLHTNGTESMKIVLEVPAEKWNAYTVVSCEVKNLCSSNTQSYNISKTKDPKSPAVRILPPSDDDLSGSDDATLLCAIEGFYPAEISVHWELNGKRLTEQRFTNSPLISCSKLKGCSMYSALRLLASGSVEGTYSCVVNHESFENPIRSTKDNIYASVNQQAPTVEVLQGHNGLLCLVHGYSPSAINITWLLNDVTEQLKGNTSSSAKGPDGKFSITSHLNMQASEWEPGTTYTCRVGHITGFTNRSISKPEMIEQTIYFDENKSGTTSLDQAEETWNMACAFIILFIISLLYGCSVTLVKVKIA